MIHSLLAICTGASAGAILRWLLGLALNPVFPTLPLGTLAANWLGGYIIGLALSIFAFFPSLGAEWRLLVVTGFLGALIRGLHRAQVNAHLFSKDGAPSSYPPASAAALGCAPARFPPARSVPAGCSAIG